MVKPSKSVPVLTKVLGAVAGFFTQAPVQQTQTTAQISGLVNNKKMAGTETIEPEARTLTPDEVNTINLALSRLSAHCDIVSALVKLADYADSKPAMFKMTLESM